ncbi:MAG: sensor histidine kinase [Thermodesulfobacteriota bacterium]
MKKIRGITIETVIGYFRKKSRLFILTLGFVFVLFLGIIDYLTGPWISFSIFYLIPISMVTWFVNRRAGILISAISAITWLMAELSWEVNYLNFPIPYWNATVRFGFFLVVVLFMSALRELNEHLEIKVAERTATLEAEVTERKRAEEALRKSHEQLRALAAHLESTREEEGKRIAREVHDNLAQSLTVLNMNLFELESQISELGDKPRRDLLLNRIRSMSNLIDTTVHAVREIATELRPRMLDDLGVEPAIEWKARDFQERTGIQCEFISENINLDQERSTAIFRIFQETLTNVARHAKATRVNIKLKEDTDKIILEVEDNGRGITEKEIYNPRSLGLLGMRERALLFGGEINMTGRQGIGTTVTVCIPIKRQES